MHFSPQVDDAVRAALVPSASLLDLSKEGLKTAASFGFPKSGEPHHDAPSYPGLSLTHDASDVTVASYVLRTSHLDKIQNLLVRGERRAAFQYAADEKLWAHAMVIASSIDKDSWKEVVHEFVRAELGGVNPATLASSRSSTAKEPPLAGREPLKVAYSLFAGQGAASGKILRLQ